MNKDPLKIHACEYCGCFHDPAYSDCATGKPIFHNNVKWETCDGYQECRGKECTITLEPRPSYCDRGNFIAKLHSFGKLGQEIDNADMWPRYYFDETRAKLEIEAWLIKREQEIFLKLL